MNTLILHGFRENPITLLAPVCRTSSIFLDGVRFVLFIFLIYNEFKGRVRILKLSLLKYKISRRGGNEVTKKTIESLVSCSKTITDKPKKNMYQDPTSSVKVVCQNNIKSK